MSIESGQGPSDTNPVASIDPALGALRDLTQQSWPAGALYVVATPLGNIGDITLRALHLLATADTIACEDTRNTGQLLSRYGLRVPLLAAHQHNERAVAQQIVGLLQQGQRVALVSDAGSPAISDPGAKIVEAVHEAGLRVIPLPGASAGIAALSAAGMPDAQFHFAGFLPTKGAQREQALRQLAVLPATLVFYEAPHRILETVSALQAVLGGERICVIGRELTKQFEQVHRLPLADARAWLEQDANRQRGEFVLLVQGAIATADSDEIDPEAERVLKLLLAELPLKQAATLAAGITGLKKNALYQRALALKSGTDADE